MVLWRSSLDRQLISEAEGFNFSWQGEQSRLAYRGMRRNASRDIDNLFDPNNLGLAIIVCSSSSIQTPWEKLDESESTLSAISSQGEYLFAAHTEPQWPKYAYFIAFKLLKLFRPPRVQEGRTLSRNILSRKVGPELQGFVCAGNHIRVRRIRMIQKVWIEDAWSEDKGVSRRGVHPKKSFEQVTSLTSIRNQG